MRNRGSNAFENHCYCRALGGSDSEEQLTVRDHTLVTRRE